MRFNQKELAFIALQPAETFDLQGLLWLKERDGFFFSRTESYTERWCRLKGNLLFYCKGNEKTSELAGLLVLERCSFSKDLRSTRKYAFTLVFDRQDEGQHYHFAANSEAEYDDWSKRIKNASYEKLKEKLQKLCEQITQMTGQHPLPLHHPFRDGIEPPMPDPKPDNTPIAPGSDEPPLLEISMACNDLKPSVENKYPNAIVIVSTMTPPGATWTRLAQTEIIEQKSHPYFLTTVSIPSGGNFSEVTRLKLAVFDVRDRDKEEMTHLGQAVCTIKDILTSTNQKIQLSLTGLDSPTASGTITLLGWKVVSPPPPPEPELNTAENVRPRCGSINKPKFDNMLERKFRFPTILGTVVKVVDMMGESFLTFRIPQQLLKIFIIEEKQKILDLNNLGNLNLEWDNARQEILDNHFKLVSNYTDSFRHLNNLRERQDKGVSSWLNFKPSRLKTDKALAFVTTNLHLQRLKVIDGSIEQGYDVVTFGAPSAHSMKYSKGGLRRLLGNLRETYLTQSGGDNRANRARNKRIELEMLKHKFSVICENFKRAVANNNMEEIIELSTKLQEMINNVLKYHEMTFIIDSLVALSNSRPPASISFEEHGEKYTYHGLSDSPPESDVDDPECQVLRNTIESSMALILKMINELNKESPQLLNGGKSGKMTGEKTRSWARVSRNLDSAIDDDLSRFVNALINKFNLGMIFVLLQEESRHAQTMQDLRQRRDICLSQAVTALICGFEAKIYTSLFDEKFMKQLCQIGILAEFECLLSTYGDEMGMLEDMSIAIRDLSCVKFKFACSDNDTIPYVTGTRANIQVTILLETEYFCYLPKELQEGKLIQVSPVIFTQGINEHATLAERFGDTSLQEAINDEHFSYIHLYYEKFRDHFPDEAAAMNPREPALGALMEHLKTNIANKKNKNVDILFLAQEICWRMNGIRFISCKSAKDRTSMSVTLEQCSILKRKHNLQPEIFNHAIDAMRSEGTRRENCFKNAGIRRYAFNYWQVMALPRLYRPPDGTYGRNIQA